MFDFEEVVQEIGREYVKRRKEIEESWQYEFSTQKNQNSKESQILEANRIYKEKIREKKIEILLNDTLYRQ